MTDKKIVVAYDGSADSKKAVEMAVDLAKNMPAKVVIVSAYDVPTALIDEGRYTVFAKDFEAACEEKLAEVQKHCAERGVNADTFVLQGNPADEIIKYAQEEAAYLIITGTRGLGGFARLLMGSVAHKLVTYSDIPVLVVK